MKWFIQFFTSSIHALLIVIFAVSCRKKEVTTPPPPIVIVMETKASAVPLSTTLIGQLDSPQNVEVRARVEGFVDQMLFTEGTEVKQGSILFELDKKPFLERLSAAKGGLQEARAALNKYEKDVARLRPLAERRAIPMQDLDNAEAAVDVGRASVHTATAKVESALLDLSYCEIKAPVAGLIGAKQVSIGELVGKGEPTLMATISTLDPIWFYCNVSEVDYLNAKNKSRTLGREVETLPLSLMGADGKQHPEPGKFVFIDRAVDFKTGTLRVRASFPNSEKLLRPGMFARVKVDLGTKQGAILLPERAVVQMQEKSFAWVVTNEGLSHQRPISLGEQVGPYYIISAGLNEGERVIVEGLQKTREGALVTAMTAEQLAAMHAASTAKTANP